MQYDIQKHELTLDINDSRVKLTFESDVQFFAMLIDEMSDV